MDDECEVCGAVGYRHLLVLCNSCKNSTRHRYCMNPVIYGGSSIEWLCEDCTLKHNEVVESSKWRFDDHHSIKLGSSIIDEPNVNGVEATEEPWSWGCRRLRSHKTRRYYTWGRRRLRSRKSRRDSTDACTKHFSCGGPFNSSEMFVDEKSKHNDVEKEGENKNSHLIHGLESSDGSGHSISGLAAEIQKTMGDVQPTMDTTECLDLSKKTDSCTLSMNYVEGSIPQGSKANFVRLICVERPHSLVTKDSCRTVSVMEQENGSSHALDSAEESHPLEVVDRDGSSYSPLDPALEIEEQGTDASASVNDVEQSHPSFTEETSPSWSSEDHGDGSSPTSESWEQPQPLEVVRPWDDVPNSILGSKPPSNDSQPMQALDPDVGNMDVDVLDPSMDCLDSRSMSKTVEPSSYSNGGDSAAEEDHAERIECLSGAETVTPAVDNVQDCLSAEPSTSSNGGDSSVEKNSAERTECLSRMETVNPALDNVQESSTSTAKEWSGPKGRNTQNDVPKASVSAGKNVVCSQIPQSEDVNNEALPSKNVGPCKATKTSFKKGSNRHTQCHTEHQKTKLIMKDRNADPAQLKSCRTSNQLDHTCSSSSELSSKTKEVNDVEPRCSSPARTFEDIVPMKRKQLGEDAEAMQQDLEGSNPPSRENDGQGRMNRRLVESSAMNQTRSAENYEEVLCPGNSNNQHANNHRQTKKQRRANKVEKVPLGNPRVRIDAEQLASDAAVAGHCSLSRMPVVSAPTDQQHFICTQPIDKPYWTGIMKIGQEYISLAAHLSNQVHKKVQELSRSLPPVMKVTKQSKLAWAKWWEASGPTARCIDLYFFSDNMRPNKDLDRLVQYVTDHNIVLKYVFGFAKLLIFPSALLPEQCQTFQGKHYLWGVFKSRPGMSEAATQVKQKVPTSPAVDKKEHQDKVQDNIQDEDMPVLKHTALSKSQPSPVAVHDVGTGTDLGDHRKLDSNSEAPPTMLFGLVAQTPRSEQIIKELENEGALMFAVKGLVQPAPVRL